MPVEFEKKESTASQCAHEKGLRRGPGCRYGDSHIACMVGYAACSRSPHISGRFARTCASADSSGTALWLMDVFQNEKKTSLLGGF